MLRYYQRLLAVDKRDVVSVTVATDTAAKVTLTSRRARSLNAAERTEEHLGAVLPIPYYEAPILVLYTYFDCRTKVAVPGIRSAEMTLRFQYSSTPRPRSTELVQMALHIAQAPSVI